MGLLWVFFSSAIIFGSLLTALVYTEPFYFFLLMAGLSLIANTLFCFIPHFPKTEEPDSARSIDHLAEDNQEKRKVTCGSICRLMWSRQMLFL